MAPDAAHAIAFVLHAHLPYVPATEGGQSMEERWLYEALAQCYLPLLDVLARLDDDGVAPRWTISLSPTLLAMLGETRRRAGFRRYLDETQARVRDALRGAGPLRGALDDLDDRIAAARRRWEAVGEDVGRALAAWHHAGAIELITTAATHALLPALGDPLAVRLQLRLGEEAFRRATGVSSRGRWLPECAFAPEMEAELAAADVAYAIVDAHAVSSVFAPVRGPAGVAFFARDPWTAERVWSRDSGYPAHPAYREFHHHLAIPETADRLASGIKPFRITGPGPDKAPYDAVAAAARAQLDAADFVADRLRAMRTAGGPTPALCVAPFDAELFGHWWSEGPLFLEAVARQIHDHADPVRACTLGAWLGAHPDLPAGHPVSSSWGEGGHARSWFGPATSDLHRHVAHAWDGLRRAATTPRARTAVAGRALDQCVREVALAQASDWPFMAERGEVVAYARERITRHAARAIRLADWSGRDALEPPEEAWLAHVEEEDAFGHDITGPVLRSALGTR